MDKNEQQAASSRTNVEIVRHVYEAFQRRNPSEILSLFAPDIEIAQSSEIPWGGK